MLFPDSLVLPLLCFQPLATYYHSNHAQSMVVKVAKFHTNEQLLVVAIVT